jgi:hypothetical protein
MRKARKRHRCDDNIALDGRRHTIEPGEQYQRTAYFPKSDEAASGFMPTWPATKPRPLVYKSCLPCATARDAIREHVA